MKILSKKRLSATYSTLVGDSYLEYLRNEYEPYVITAMATVYVNREYGFCLQVHSSESRIGEPYFKVFNNISFQNATKVARISFLRPQYIQHRDRKEHWNLNASEKKIIFRAFLEKEDDVTVWQELIANYNLEKTYINRLKDSYFFTLKEKNAILAGKYDEAESILSRLLGKDWRSSKNLQNTIKNLQLALPIDLKMPNYQMLGV